MDTYRFECSACHTVITSRDCETFQDWLDYLNEFAASHTELVCDEAKLAWYTDRGYVRDGAFWVPSSIVRSDR